MYRSYILYQTTDNNYYVIQKRHAGRYVWAIVPANVTEEKIIELKSTFKGQCVAWFHTLAEVRKKYGPIKAKIKPVNA